MKSFLTGIVFAVASVAMFSEAFASGQVLVSSGEIYLPKRDRSTIEKVVTIEVNDNSSATISVKTYNNPSSDVEPNTVEFTRELSFAVQQSILADVIALSNVLTTVQSPRAVCEMVPPLGGFEVLSVRNGYQNDSGVFEGEMRPVLRQNGCWDTLYVKPSEEMDLIKAYELKGKLETLAFESLVNE